jgi:MFS family permease
VTFDAPTQRVIASHTLGALALSLPWPLLLVLVAEQSDDPWLLGLAGAARMLPFVLCSWVGGRLADAFRRDLIVRATLVVRAVMFLVAALAVADGRVWVAVAATTLAVAVATPAYPAVVAALPGVAGGDYRRATHLLVTIEVGSFVVGAAMGGLLLHPVTRELVPWVALGLTVLALVLVVPVSMPAPVRPEDPVARVSGLSALRSSPAACRAIAVMAVVNLVDAVAALALLPVALDTWSVGAAGYGVATGVLGFSALAAPALRRMGPTSARTMRRGLVLAGAGLVLLTPAPGLGWALVPIAVLGAASVGVEAAATGVLQESVPDEVRATVLGLNDSIIIAAALVGALAAPALVEVTGGRVVFAVLAVVALLVAWWAKPVTANPQARATIPVRVPAAVGATR